MVDVSPIDHDSLVVVHAPALALDVGHVHRHPSELVDHLHEAMEVHQRVVVDGGADDVLDGLLGQLDAAVVVRVVDLVSAVIGDIPLQVPGNPQHCRPLRPGVDRQDHHRV